ncbi:inorganic phosphate transporter [Alkalibacter rhizosphaerae]|uniref:Inorganic phosphate transporter n=1 Tax=Alkalibacter rhizosphaerae TaxID=2815577 RepID=A0A974XEW3_9FIRM|nr:inorganic phosphate transporter [Alkalibacter rhizosphaerae]QSX08421.1 inorganic phosphate transporter [Alkalibacter rhizosphaerae]
MDVTIYGFLQQMLDRPELFVTVMLTLGVFLVNGWTDAPNAIATCITTRSLSIRKAIVMAAILNFFGVFLMMLINSTVAQTIYRMVDFGGDARHALIALCAAMVAIVTWATLAWRLGFPTSESHALIAGISGAAIALQNGLGGINGTEWIKIIYGLVFSLSFGMGLGYLFTTAIRIVFRAGKQRKLTSMFKKAQILGSGAMAFMHGAQDGQKFLGVFMLGVFLSQGEAGQTNFAVPLWIVLLCSLIMAFGTSVGGVRIIKTVGLDMVKLQPYQGFSADFAASITLLLSSMFGFPVSTTHTKTTAIMGSGMAVRMGSINWSVVKNMAYAWILTFPGCGLLGYLMAKLFLYIFT